MDKSKIKKNVGLVEKKSNSLSNFKKKKSEMIKKQGKVKRSVGSLASRIFSQ